MWHHVIYDCNPFWTKNTKKYICKATIRCQLFKSMFAYTPRCQKHEAHVLTGIHPPILFTQNHLPSSVSSMKCLCKMYLTCLRSKGEYVSRKLGYCIIVYVYSIEVCMTLCTWLCERLQNKITFEEYHSCAPQSWHLRQCPFFCFIRIWFIK